MELLAWNSWLQTINESSEKELDRELHFLMTEPGIPFVERNLRMGYLYFTKDCLGAAASVFRKIESVLTQKKDDPEFLQENEEGLHILWMGYRLEKNMCGGYELREVGCDPACCGPLCCCLGAAGLAVCNIDLNSITNCGADPDNPGCLDNCMNNCCSGCCTCVNCHWMDPDYKGIPR